MRFGHANCKKYVTKQANILPSKSCVGPLQTLQIVILIVVKFVLMLDLLSNTLFYMVKM